MHADAHFLKGRSHRICEDYALAGSIDDRPFVVVCDGCSSSPHTDFGARIMAHSFKDVLNTLRVVSIDSLPELAVAQAYVRAKSLGLDITSLDCTLLAAWLEGDYLHVVQTGDGGIVYKYKDDTLRVEHLEFESGAPHYLSYSLDFNRSKQYFDEYGTDAAVVTQQVAADGGRHTPRARAPYNFKSVGLCCSVPHDQLAAVGIFSDGLSTFKDRKTFSTENADQVIHKLMSFKTTKGTFVQRRMKRVMGDYVKDGIEPEDDISLAVIHV